MKLRLWRFGPTASLTFHWKWTWLPRLEINWQRGKYGEKVILHSWLFYRFWTYV